MLKFNFEMESADMQKALAVVDNAISGMIKSDFQQQDMQRESMEYSHNKEQISGFFQGVKELLGPVMPLIMKYLEKESDLVRIPKIQEELDAAKQRIRELSEANQALLVKLDEYENPQPKDGKESASDNNGNSPDAEDNNK